MRAVDGDGFAVYVYREFGERHKLPHCHIRWPDTETVVSLPSLNVIAGPTLERAIKGFLIEHLDEICDAWNSINPEAKV
jgi:hypothetical protein